MNKKDEKKETESSAPGVQTSGKTEGQPMGMSLPEFRAKMRKEVGLPEITVTTEKEPDGLRIGDREIVIVDPVCSPDAIEKKTNQDGNAMKTNLMKSGETGAVEPLVSKAGDGVSADDVEKLIVKKKSRLFGKHEKLEDLSVADLEILRQQKIKEEQVEAIRLKDEATLAEMRADKKSYYDMIRNKHKMHDSFEARLESFFGEKRLPLIKILLELWGLKIIDKKHVFTDAELESFYEKARDQGVRCPYDSFALHAKQHMTIRSPADEHRAELMKKVVAER